jgi:hypothetical protein
VPQPLEADRDALDTLDEVVDRFVGKFDASVAPSADRVAPVRPTRRTSTDMAPSVKSRPM